MLNSTAQLTESPDLVDLIARAIVDEPPLAVKEGGMIRDGFDADLDELRNAQRGGKDWIAKLQQDEIERTGITSLKVRFNSVFGYYIEVTKSNLDKVPPHYIRKQTVANGERFITPELKEMEGKILGAEERSVKLEYELFQRVREEVLGQLREIQQTAAALAQLDVLRPSPKPRGCTTTAARRSATKACCKSATAGIRCWNRQLVDERFVPNDTALASSAARRCSPLQRRGDASDSQPATADDSRFPRSPSSPGRTWRANPPTSGRWRCSRCWRTPAVSSRPRKRGLISWTASSPASARATTWRAGNPRSWSR